MTERYFKLREKLSKLEGEIVLVDNGAGDGRDGINVAYVDVVHYNQSDEIELYFAGDSDPWSLHEQLDLYPNSKFYKVQKGDEI